MWYVTFEFHLRSVNFLFVIQQLSCYVSYKLTLFASEIYLICAVRRRHIKVIVDGFSGSHGGKIRRLVGGQGRRLIGGFRRRG